MRKASQIAVIALMTVSGCQTNTPTPTAAGTNANEAREDTVRIAKERAQQLCSFVPTAKTILEILDLGIPNVSKGALIAEKICDAIGTKSLNPNYKGVPIRGEYK